VVGDFGEPVCSPLFIYFFGEMLLAIGCRETSPLDSNPKQCDRTKLASKLITMSKRSPSANPYHPRCPTRSVASKNSSYSDETYYPDDDSYDDKPTAATSNTSKPKRLALADRSNTIIDMTLSSHESKLKVSFKPRKPSASLAVAYQVR